MSKISLCLVAASCVGVMVLTACSPAHKSGTGHAEVVTKASADQQNALLGRVKSLAGTWEMTDDKGQKQVGAVFSVSSNGSTVREVMFPGSSHEMTNMYTMDGGGLRLTHYCAMGNQPHMKCRSADKHPDGSVTLAFEPAGVSDLNAGDESYMGKMTLTVYPNGTATQEWWQLKNGKVTGEHNMVFKLRRKG